MNKIIRTFLLTALLALFVFSVFALESTLTLKGGISGAQTDITKEKDHNGMLGMSYEIWMAKWLALGIHPYITKAGAGPETHGWTYVEGDPQKDYVYVGNFQSNLVGGDLLFKLRPNWKKVAPYITAGGGIVNFFPKYRDGHHIAYDEYLDDPSDELPPEKLDYDYTVGVLPTVGAGLTFFTNIGVDFDLGVQKNFMMSDFLDGIERGDVDDSYWMAFLGVSHTFGKKPPLPPKFEIMPDTQHVSDRAGTTNFYIDVDPEAMWSATENENWLSIAPTGGYGDADFVVTYEANPKTTPRTGYIYVTSGKESKTLTVVQEGFKPMLNVTPGVQNVTSKTGITNFNVDSNIAWSVSENENWLSVTPLTGNKNGTLTVEFDANPDFADRVGQINITGEGITKTVTVKQTPNIQPALELNNVHFEFDKSAIDKLELYETEKPILDANVAALKQNPNTRVELQGHADYIGEQDYNLRLSERRASAVYNYLVNNGIDKERLTMKGFGEDQPTASNETDEGRRLNRRVEFIVK